METSESDAKKPTARPPGNASHGRNPSHWTSSQSDHVLIDISTASRAEAYCHWLHGFALLGGSPEGTPGLLICTAHHLSTGRSAPPVTRPPPHAIRSDRNEWTECASRKADVLEYNG